MSDHPIPSHASVVVIGGGILGCSTLYHLAKLGITDAVLIERNKLTSGTTWHSAAQVRALRSTRNLTDLIRYSIELFSSLEEETGQATGWINKGSLSIATSQDRMTHIRRQAALAALYGVEASVVSAGEAKERWPLMNAEDVIGAVWSPDDGRVSPSDLCAALVKGAKARGAKVFEDTPMLGIETDGGRVTAVETAAGRIRTDAVALCTGLWSREAAARAGAEVPVWPCEHFYLLTKPVAGIEGNLPTLSDHDSHLYIRDDSGGLLVGCFEPLGKSIDPARLGEDFAFQLLPEDWDHFEPMMTGALHRLPALETAEVKMLLNGPESFTPDGSFLLGETAETRGLFLGCGMNSVGVATGGGAGMALAHTIRDGHPPVDLHEADPKRFPACLNSAGALAARAPEVLGKHYEITYPGRQWSSARDLRRMPLDAAWRGAGAQFGQVYGWERPLYFSDEAAEPLSFGKPAWFDAVGAEIRIAHEGAAIFDQSTFGKIAVRGPDAEQFLNRVCANDMAKPPGRAIYTTMLNARGGIESDLTALRLDDESYRLYVGTGAVKRDLAWLRRHLKTDERVTVTDETEEYAVLGLMGPESGAIADRIGATDLNSIRYFSHAASEIAGRPIRAARLSYVGEYGWEITCRSEDAEIILHALSEAGARPAGLFAQTAMRIEKQFLAYGHDIDTDLDPLQLGLGFAVAWETGFIGRDALEARRERSDRPTVATLIAETDSWPLGNEPVRLDGAIVGKTSSAAFGYRIGAPVALALLDPHAIGKDLEIDVAGEPVGARAQAGAAFDPNGNRMRARIADAG
ncbi:FAD-dependent oxidoreductase [Nisaea acidiphila]|uniref:FAD-dependent oxidoreductase n=1 Tax=Nisaea acidiphila TaxID=1862145 RepID=A0A9J7AVR3_9PROT|nr:FAD-dependent oxidoreductase [Nisaea acidiphila]UUX49509.1 FAD-dependent oxidoreductase [Nisaea acidiphila]